MGFKNSEIPRNLWMQKPKTLSNKKQTKTGIQSNSGSNQLKSQLVVRQDKFLGKKMWTTSRTLSLKFKATSKPERQKISVEMLLAILLLWVPVALGYTENYAGFSQCGADGWYCGYNNGKYEITYKCAYGQTGARIWVWTARLPSGSSILTVRNCRHLEVHTDCTVGTRKYMLTELRVINVGLLEFISPLQPGIFLHDNDQVSQMLPSLYIKDVEETDFYPGIFDKPGGSCNYKDVVLNSMYLSNVRRIKFRKDLFRSHIMESFFMQNVQIQLMEYNALELNGNVSIIESSFPKLPTNAISLKGQNISFVRNSFEKIPNLGIRVQSKYFEFSTNRIEEMGTMGLMVMASHVSITTNYFNHLDPGAFQGITPGFAPNNYELGFRLSYNFSDNVVSNISPGSLHPDWEIYRKVCSEITYFNNVFDCSCLNLGWMSVSNGLGPKLSKSKEFYDLFVEKEVNTCKGYHDCPLTAVVSRIQDVCNNKTNVSMICSEWNSLTKLETTTSRENITGSTTIQENKTTYEPTLTTEPIEVTEKIIPVLPYKENQTSYKEERTIPIWIVVVPVLVALAAVSLGIFIWWYKKRRQRQLITTIYKNQKGIDGDNILVLNEHHNELYDKQ